MRATCRRLLLPLRARLVMLIPQPRPAFDVPADGAAMLPGIGGVLNLHGEDGSAVVVFAANQGDKRVRARSPLPRVQPVNQGLQLRFFVHMSPSVLNEVSGTRIPKSAVFRPFTPPPFSASTIAATRAWGERGEESPSLRPRTARTMPWHTEQKATQRGLLGRRIIWGLTCHPPVTGCANWRRR